MSSPNGVTALHEPECGWKHTTNYYRIVWLVSRCKCCSSSAATLRGGRSAFPQLWRLLAPWILGFPPRDSFHLATAVYADHRLSCASADRLQLVAVSLRHAHVLWLARVHAGRHAEAARDLSELQP